MGGEEDGLAERPQAGDHVPGRTAGGWVEAGGGLVEEDQLGVADQGERDVESAPLPTGELLDQGFAFLGSSPTTAIVSSISRGAG